MAIAFARAEWKSRKEGANACRSSAYNSRTRIEDDRTGEIFDFTHKDDNVYHEILIPQHASSKFKEPEYFSNLVEKTEKRKDSQLLVEYVLALPKEKEVTLEIQKEMVYEFVKRMGWIKEGLVVQMDIHAPHENEINWHVHLLVSTRRIAENGLDFFYKKATDLFPKILNGMVQKEVEHDVGAKWSDIQNYICEKNNLDIRVDANGAIAQVHVGPKRMRGSMNTNVIHNEQVVIANDKLIKTGEDLLKLVSKEKSVFTKGDLARASKYITCEIKKERVINEALQSKNICELYFKNGEKSEKYTTVEVREEELKLKRLVDYIAANKNNLHNETTVDALKKANALSTEQKEALNKLLLTDRGIRVLEGKAGTGKSHVLGKFVEIANSNKQQIFGIAPTHKASLELEKVGFKNTDTVKGFIFKFHNEKIYVKPGSTIVVDEAAMLGNADMMQLLKIAGSRQCNIVFTGDDAQLSSIERGGLFSDLKNMMPVASLENIKRQQTAWGREVAKSFAIGDIEKGVNILDKHNKIAFVSTINTMIDHWMMSSEEIRNRLIIAIKREDVNSINEEIHHRLKEAGILKGDEYLISVNKSIVKEKSKRCNISDNYFMGGERIVFTETNKEIGVNNGDFAEILAINERQITVRLDKDLNNEQAKEITFDPNKYAGFTHGYASTVYKSQGASIFSVWLYHNWLGFKQNTYVSLTRNIKEVAVFASDKTRSKEELISQLSPDFSKGTSLKYYTKEDFTDDKQSNSMFSRVARYTADKITKFADIYFTDRKYFAFEEQTVSGIKIEKVTNEILAEQNKFEQEISKVQQAQEMKLAVGMNYTINNIENNKEQSKASNNNQPNPLVVSKLNTNNVIDGSVKVGARSRHIQTNANNIEEQHNIASAMPVVKVPSQPEKETSVYKNSFRDRFYRNFVPAETNSTIERDRYIQRGREELKELKAITKVKAEIIFKDYFGEENKHLSGGNTLRFGEHGKIVAHIRGEKAGIWHDFSAGIGGDIISLVQAKQHTDFTGAIDYLKSRFGIVRQENLKHIDKQEQSNNLEEILKQRADQEKKILQANKLYAKAKSIGKTSIASKYLAESRNISCSLSSDLKTTAEYVSSVKQTMPVLVAFARNSEGKITGGQKIILDAKTNKKANIEVNKKSFGKIAGSFVEIAGCSNSTVRGKSTNSRVTIIAEGIETALSIKQAGIDAKILCSLGVSNIKNYKPNIGEIVIIAGDNDGKGAITEKVLQEAREQVAKDGNVTKVITPKERGDFNDILQAKGSEVGTREIRSLIEPIIHFAKLERGEQQRATLAELTDNEKLQYIVTSYAKDEQQLASQFKQHTSVIAKLNYHKIPEVVDHYLKHGIEEATKFAKTQAIKIVNEHINRDINYLAFNKEISIQRHPELYDKRIVYDLNRKPHNNEADYLKAMLGNDLVKDYIMKSPETVKQLKEHGIEIPKQTTKTKQAEIVRDRGFER